MSLHTLTAVSQHILAFGMLRARNRSAAGLDAAWKTLLPFRGPCTGDWLAGMHLHRRQESLPLHLLVRQGFMRQDWEK